MMSREEAEREWARLSDSYLRVIPAIGGWRYSRSARTGEPTQGWKLHVSATLPNAITAFARCAPLLTREDVLFKSVKHLGVLAQLNSGIPFGFSQVGKFMTVYPRDERQALALASRLHELTMDLAAPTVPFDKPYMSPGSIYYRYGAFGQQQLELEDGESVSAIRDRDGKLVADLREPGRAVPQWLDDPFPALASESHGSVTPLQTRYLCFEAMMQRGKGGVYRGVDIAAQQTRLCVIKEGRRDGETGWDGSDGRHLVEREQTVLRALEGTGIGAPRVIESFVIDGHRYLALEHIDGESLLHACADPERKLPLDVALAYAAATARLVAELHRLGWVWRDCKPANLIVDREGALRPIDFEGAVRHDEPSSRPWGTPGFMARRSRDPAASGSNLHEDLFALGATIHQLCTSWLMHRDDTGISASEVTHRPALGTLRRGVPLQVRRLARELMAEDSFQRPSAEHATRVLRPYALDRLPVPDQQATQSQTVLRVRERMWRQARELVFDDGAPMRQAAA
jgi:hypothetical protein